MHNEKRINSSHKIICFETPGYDSFFGYYDISPFNKVTDEILYVEKNRKFNYVSIVVAHIGGTDKKVLSNTYAWNWQQGCRLRWLPCNGYREISYNDFQDGHYCNVIYNITTQKGRTINWPLYDISSDATIGLSLDFERLGLLRPGYGYTCQQKKLKDTGRIGIFVIDLVKNEIIEDITLDEIKDAMAYSGNNHDCYINHLSFAPNRKRFLFFFIEIRNGYHKASLVVYDLCSAKIIPIEVDGKAAHSVWEADDNIICTVYDQQRICRYYRYSIANGTKQMICTNSLREDGHPSLFDERHIVTDTYPDRNGFQHIKLIDIKKDIEIEHLAKIYSMPSISVERRTDLHPRLNCEKNLISFDANVSGRRCFYVVETGIATANNYYYDQYSNNSL
jgi:hypothetical protein